MAIDINYWTAERTELLLKKLDLGASRGLDPTVVKYDFPVSVEGCLPHKITIELN